MRPNCRDCESSSETTGGTLALMTVPICWKKTQELLGQISLPICCLKTEYYDWEVSRSLDLCFSSKNLVLKADLWLNKIFNTNMCMYSWDYLECLLESKVTRCRKGASFGQECQRCQMMVWNVRSWRWKRSLRIQQDVVAALTGAVGRWHQGWQCKPLEMMKQELNEKGSNTIFPGCLEIQQFPHFLLITEI